MNATDRNMTALYVARRTARTARAVEAAHLALQAVDDLPCACVGRCRSASCVNGAAHLAGVRALEAAQREHAEALASENEFRAVF